MGPLEKKILLIQSLPTHRCKSPPPPLFSLHHHRIAPRGPAEQLICTRVQLAKLDARSTRGLSTLLLFDVLHHWGNLDLDLGSPWPRGARGYAARAPSGARRGNQLHAEQRHLVPIFSHRGANQIPGVGERDGGTLPAPSQEGDPHIREVVCGCSSPCRAEVSRVSPFIFR